MEGKLTKTIVAAPSIMKIHCQPAILSFPFRLEIAAARRPPKLPENAAAEKNIACSLYKLMISRKEIMATYSSNTKFVTLIPAGEEVVYTWVETCFCDSEEPTCCHET